VVILAPTYGEYEIACRLAGAKVILIQAEEEKGFQWNISEACRKIRRLRPRLAFLCNPNNPTGIYLEQAAVEELATAMGEGWLILDEAYISFVEEAWQATSLLGLGKVVCLRSLTKDYALTALRLGYALCPPEVATTLFLYQPCWSVNAAAQAAGIAALSQPEHLFRWRRYIAESKSYLERELQELGYKVSPSAANFLLAEVGDAVALRARLLSRGICVRDCSSFGLPRYIRIAARSIPDSERLVRALKEVGK
jgi:histidinol-phosphate aminotransferase